MKIALIALMTLASQVALGADDYLVSKAMREVRASRQIIQDLIYNSSADRYQLERANRLLSTAENELGAALENMPPAPPIEQVTGSYCAAACTDSSGRPDLSHTDGASGQFEAEAKETAINNTQRKFNCTWGVKPIGCSRQVSTSRFNSVAACTDSSGQADQLHVRGGAGYSRIEAETQARQQTMKTFSCTWGVANVISSDDLQPTYCVAACTDSSGSPDLQHSKGSEGRNTADAQGKALISTQSAYNCTWGVKITECSSH